MNVLISFQGIMEPSVNLSINNLINDKKVSLMQLVSPVLKILKNLVDSSEYSLNFHSGNSLCSSFLAKKGDNISEFYMASFSTRHQKAHKWHVLLWWTVQAYLSTSCPSSTGNLGIKFIITLGRIPC